MTGLLIRRLTYISRGQNHQCMMNIINLLQVKYIIKVSNHHYLWLKHRRLLTYQRKSSKRLLRNQKFHSSKYDNNEEIQFE